MTTKNNNNIKGVENKDVKKELGDHLKNKNKKVNNQLKKMSMGSLWEDMWREQPAEVGKYRS